MEETKPGTAGRRGPGCMLCSAASFPSYKTPANSGQPSSLFASYGSLRPLRQPQALALDTLRRSLASGHRRPWFKHQQASAKR